ncbi:MAG: 2-hydroxyacyl-CoA dehydratase [Candidatus Thermoplasmatota archaeon]|jgi:benzoyl-CoA reductase subunit C|nr:2-hydroxyacyl-CoA dehydratase [Candidatus Thermoplasmatota archaeon]
MTPEEIFSKYVEDSYTTFQTVKEWKQASGRPAVGYFPVYFPSELAHAMGFLPVGLLGASGKIPLDRATAHTQSFVCSISRSVFQLVLQGNLDAMEAIVFSNICDVARNLSGITQRNVQRTRIEYLHLPINNTSQTAVPYLRSEYERLANTLFEVGGVRLDTEKLRESVELYNRKRALEAELGMLRGSRPWALSYSSYYSTLRAGTLMPIESYLPLLERFVEEAKQVEGKAMDKIRVVVLGTFCEQPPLGILKAMEDAGCYIVQDEGLVGERWLGRIPLAQGKDPLTALAEGYVSNPNVLTVRYHPGLDKQQRILEKAREQKAEGVVFLTPKFCEPALYDYVIGKSALDKEKIPYLHIEYEESASSFEHARTMVETFAESILFD